MDSDILRSFSNDTAWPHNDANDIKDQYLGVFKISHLNAAAFSSFPVELVLNCSFISITQKTGSPLYWNPETNPIAELTTFTTTIFDMNGNSLLRLTSNNATRIVQVEILVDITDLINQVNGQEKDADR